MVNMYVDGFPNCIANQLTGFYMRVTLASKEKHVKKHVMLSVNKSMVSDLFELKTKFLCSNHLILLSI